MLQVDRCSAQVINAVSFNTLELETNKKHLLLKQWGRRTPLSPGADRLTRCGSPRAVGHEVVVMLLRVQRGEGRRWSLGKGEEEKEKERLGVVHDLVRKKRILIKYLLKLRLPGWRYSMPRLVTAFGENEILFLFGNRLPR